MIVLSNFEDFSWRFCSSLFQQKNALGNRINTESLTVNKDEENLYLDPRWIACCVDM